MDFNPHVLPNMPLQAQKVFMGLLITSIRCDLYVNLASKVSPKYLSLVNTNILDTKMARHWNLELFFLHVNRIVVVFLEFIF